jgi:hypothetical protein
MIEPILDPCGIQLAVREFSIFSSVMFLTVERVSAESAIATIASVRASEAVRAESVSAVTSVTAIASVSVSTVTAEELLSCFLVRRLFSRCG